MEIIEAGGGIVVDGRDSWMIDVPVVQYFVLIGAVSMWP